MEAIKNEVIRLSNGHDKQVEEILNSLRPTFLDKDEFLLRAGSVCKHYYFIEEGTVRLYHTKEAEEYTVWMGTSGQIFTDLESYLEGQVSRINIQAVEPTKAYSIAKERSDLLANSNAAYNTLLRRTVEIAFVNLSKNVMSYQSDEASERYNRVLNEKDWLSKYPLRYISSFIGITQSSLSRIRAKRK